MAKAAPKKGDKVMRLQDKTPNPKWTSERDKFLDKAFQLIPYGAMGEVSKVEGNIISIVWKGYGGGHPWDYPLDTAHTQIGLVRGG